MPNDQMPNYGVQMQYVSIRSTRGSKEQKGDITDAVRTNI